MLHAEKNKKSKYSILRVTDKNTVFDTGSVSVETNFKLHQVRDLTESTYILRFDRNDMSFIAGQHLTLGLPGDNQVREYSIYSSENEPYLEVLVKKVDNGMVSKRLHKLKQGDLLNVDGPFGFFTIDEEKRKTGKFLFVATGTGIAPFHSLAGTYPGLNYKILHGVKHVEEAYEKSFYPSGRHVLCTSRDPKGDFNGRVTEYLQKNKIDPETYVYLCGNCDMIYEVYDMLTSQGHSSDKIKTEVYF
jgi:ferredoxin/flavodoxin---NADP+ reductase